MPHVRDVHPRHDYLAGADEGRAEDFAAAWAAPDVRAIICVRGGYGAQRMIDHVDWSALRGAEPTVLLGYSDVTALQEAVAARLGVVTLHGPMSGTRIIPRLGGGPTAPADDLVRTRGRAGAGAAVGAPAGRRRERSG